MAQLVAQYEREKSAARNTSSNTSSSSIGYATSSTIASVDTIRPPTEAVTTSSMTRRLAVPPQHSIADATPDDRRAVQRAPSPIPAPPSPPPPAASNSSTVTCYVCYEDFPLEALARYKCSAGCTKLETLAGGDALCDKVCHRTRMRTFL